MKFKKGLAIICLIVCLFCVSGVWAGDAEGNLTANDLNDDAADAGLDTQLVAFDDNQKDDELSSNASEELSSDRTSDVVSSNQKTFADLNDAIQNSTGNDIYLNSSYSFNNDSDYSFKNGIVIDREGVTIHGNGHTLDGNCLARIFDIHSDVVLKDIVFINGNAYFGGAVYSGSQVFSVVNCTFANNSATGYGAAIYGSCSIEGCIFKNNRADVYGGAIYASGSSEVGNSFSHSSFIKNHAGLDGGALYCRNKNSFIGCKFAENTANQSAGAIVIQYGNVYFENCGVSGNPANSDAIVIYGNSSFSGCTFMRNSGKIIYSGGTCIIEDSNFDNNDHGIVCIYFDNTDANSTIKSCNFTSNKGEDKYIIQSIRNGGFSVVNCIFKNNNGNLMCNPDSVANCSFTGNVDNDGSIIYGVESCANCSFKDNSASEGVVRDVTSCRDCNFTNNSGCAVSSSRYVRNCRFVKNTGGALEVSGSCEDCVFISNSAQSYGGAICSNGASIVNCIFTSNSARGIGGAIWGYGSVKGCSFKNNVVGYYGGALYGGFSVEGCSFENNNASNGGAIYTSPNNNEVYSISNSNFTKNHVELDGGAVYCYTNNKFISCKFIENTAKQNAGAVMIQDGNNSFKKCTFTGNSARNYVIIAFSDSSFSGCSFTKHSCCVIFIDSKSIIENSNFYYNSNAKGVACIRYYSVYLNHTIRSCKFISNTAKNEIIESVKEGGFSAVNCIFKSNNGDLMCNPDSVMNCNFTGNTIKEDGIYGANSIGGCSFTGNVAKSGSIVAKVKSCVNCNFEDNTASRGVVRSVSSCMGCIFKYNSGRAVSSSSNVKNCRFVKNTGGALVVSKSCEGCTFSYNSVKDSGGAIFSDGASIVNCIFTGNSAGYNGGAIYGDGSVKGCTFKNNVAKYNGGAIYGRFSVESSNFVKNVAGLDGGAVFAMKSKIVRNCNFTNNRAKECGGALTFGHYMLIRETLSARVQNCRFINNVVTVYGGAISGGTCTNCYFSGNKGQCGSTSYETRIVPYPKSIVAPAVTTVYKAKKNLVITLKDNNGKPVKGYMLQVKAGDVVRFLTTNSKGQVKFAVGNLVPNTYTVSIKGENNKHFLTIVGSSKVTVKKATAKFTAADRTFDLNDPTKKYFVVLKNNANKAIKNAKVTINVDGVNYVAKTNYKGQAIFQLNKLDSRGKFEASIKFEGNAYYNKLFKKVFITVK